MNNVMVSTTKLTVIVEFQRKHSIYCCVPGCYNTSDSVLSDDRKVTLHQIPANHKSRKLWLSRLNNVRKNLIVNSSTRVCIAHFAEYDTSKESTIFPSKPAKVIKERRLLQRTIPEAVSVNLDECQTESETSDNINMSNVEASTVTVETGTPHVPTYAIVCGYTNLFQSFC